MDHALWPAPQVAAVGVELPVLGAEGVVYGGALEYALLHPAPLPHLVVPHLHHHAEALDEEDAAEYGQHELLVDDDGAHGDDAPDGQRARVAHEYLGRVGVVPQEADERADEGAHEHHQLLAAGDVCRPCRR